MALKKILNFIIIFLLGFLVCGMGFFYFVCTEKGSQIVARQFLSRAFKNPEISFGKMKGHFGMGLKLENLEIKNLEKLPSGNVVRIQELILENPIWDFQKANLVLRNGRIILPHSDPIVFDGNYKEGAVDFSFYARSLDITSFKEIFNMPQMSNSLSGSIGNVDMKLSGTWDEPTVIGDFYVEKFTYQDFALVESPATVNLKFKNQLEGYAPSGTITLNGGRLLAKNTQVNLQKSTFFITNDLTNPSFSIQGNSKIEDTDIQISLSGTKNNPEIKLKTDTALPTERLLLMLATGKSWKGLDTSLDKKQVSPDLVKDFIDYFMFSGSGDKLANKLGIKNIFLTLEKGKKGIGVKKKVTNNLDVGYEVNETQVPLQQPTRQQKISGDVQVSNNVSVSAEKEIRPRDVTQQGTQEKPEDNKVLLKYETKF